MSKRNEAAQAAEIQRLLESGESAQNIMSSHPELKDGWNVVAAQKVAKQPSRSAGPDAPVTIPAGPRLRPPLR